MLGLKIRRYLLSHSETARDFCKRIGISETSFYNYADKGMRPEYDIARKIEAATGEAITMKDLGYK